MQLPKQLKSNGFRFIKIRNGKFPLEKDWTNKNNYSFDDPDFQSYLAEAEGYGILCGEKSGYLAVIDADTKVVEDAVCKHLPKTFVTETGGGGFHFYYIIKDLDNKIVLQKVVRDENGEPVKNKDGRIEMEHFGEVQFTGSQVIGPGSLHSSGNKYKVKIDKPIAEVSASDVENVLAEFIEEKETSWGNKVDTPISSIAGQIQGLHRRGNELQGPHPVHGSEGGMNFAINTDKNLWHCFRCNSGGDAITLVAVLEGIITCDQAVNGLEGESFIKALRIARQKYGITKVSKAYNLDPENFPNTLEDVHKRVTKWLHITDENVIDLILAISLSNQAKNSKPIWMFLVGRSGDGKSEILNTLKGFENVKPLDRITPNTFATGMTYKGKKVHDVGEELQNKSTILIISDLACLKSIDVNKKNEIWGQFRELYDGHIYKNTGSGVQIAYDNCHVTFIGCSTPDIKAEYSIHNQLGTREIAYDIKSDKKDDMLKMKMALTHISKEDIMKKELKEAMQGFLLNRKFRHDVEIDDELMNWIKKKCVELAIFRAAASFERNTGKLRDFISPEIPTRVVQQIILLYSGLKSIDENYPDEKFRGIVNNIIKSSGDPIRQLVYYFMKDNQPNEFSTKQLHEILHMGERTLQQQCEVLTLMGYLSRDVRPEPYGVNNNFEREVYYYKWNLNVNIQDKLKLYSGDDE